MNEYTYEYYHVDVPADAGDTAARLRIAIRRHYHVLQGDAGRLSAQGNRMKALFKGQFLENKTLKRLTRIQVGKP